MKELLIKTYNDINKKNILSFIKKFLTRQQKKLIVTSNPEIYVSALKDEKIKEMLKDKNTLVIPDAVSVSYALEKVLNKKVKAYPGVELLTDLLNLSNSMKKKVTVYIYGATKEVNIKFKNFVNNNYKNIIVVGNKDGYIKNVDRIKKDIIDKKPDIIICALGVPKQELFLYDILEKIEKGILIGVGGSLDVLSGSIKRAPKIFRKLKIEWLYRIIRQPKRLKRFFKYNVRFIRLVRKCDKND